MTTLAGRRIVLGVTGGIAAYKAVEVCRRLVDAGAHVSPVLTDGAQRMVGATTFSALASEPVRTELWDDPETPIPHTKMGQAADLILVCQATAISAAVSTSTTRTPAGAWSGRVVMTTTSAPRSTASAATACPCLPDERLPM